MTLPASFPIKEVTISLLNDVGPARTTSIQDICTVPVVENIPELAC